MGNAERVDENRIMPKNVVGKLADLSILRLQLLSGLLERRTMLGQRCALDKLSAEQCLKCTQFARHRRFVMEVLQRVPSVL